MNTKERILIESLNLFARKGYEAVSVSDISKQLGMTKGALYKHYKNKKDILDCIIQRMMEKDAERAKEYEVPEELIEVDKSQYEASTCSDMRCFLEAQFVYWTEDEFASLFRRMLMIEQYKNEKMQKLYQDYLLGGVVSYIQDFFHEKMELGEMKKADPMGAAIEFYGTAFTLMNLYDISEDKGKCKELLHEQLIEFTKKYEEVRP